MEKCTYKRVMLKISGEALSGANGFGFDFDNVLSKFDRNKLKFRSSLFKGL